MKIELEDMKAWPDRDASYFYSAEVFDDAGVRYPVRIMIDGLALAQFRAETKLTSPYREFIEQLYRDELELLLKNGNLTAENSNGTVNVVFMLGSRGQQIRPGDIAISDVVEKLKSAARKMERL